MKPVKTLNELRALSHADARYAEVATSASCSLGARDDVSLHDHHEWLRIYAIATTEEGVLDQVNALISRIED